MILFQIDKFNLFYHIQNLKTEIKEDLVTASVDSSYFEGDYRTFKNRSKKTVLSCSGLISSQHFLHILRNISENDEGKGEIKAFWIEKYDDFSSEYQTLSDTNNEKNQYRLYFNYIYIDIIGINPIPLNNNDVKYQIQFDLSLVYPNLYEITGSGNGYLFTEDFIKNQIVNRYDAGVTFADGPYYDNILGQAQNLGFSLEAKSKELNEWFKKLTCCQCVNNDYIFYVDIILKPFIQSNSSGSSGIISSYVSGDGLDFRKELTNFLQLYIANPLANPQVVSSQILLPISFNRDLTQPDLIGNLNFSTNTWTTNAIVQIFRTGIDQVYLNSDVNLLNVFDTLGQKIGLEIRGQVNSSSYISITCRSAFLRDNLKLLIIHPHNQKIYGCLNNKVAFINNNFFFLRDNATGLIDLESYILTGGLVITNEMMDGTQEWLRFNPSYKMDIYTPKINNFVIFSNKYIVPNQIIPLNTALVLQIYSQDENKLI